MSQFYIVKQYRNLKRYDTSSNSILTFGTGELGYDRPNGTRKIDPSYAISVVYI